MIALVRVCSIIHLEICLPAHWLAGNSHKMFEHDWSVHSMGRMIDILENALELIVEDNALILKDNFMMKFLVNSQMNSLLSKSTLYIYSKINNLLVCRMSFFILKVPQTKIPQRWQQNLDYLLLGLFLLNFLIQKRQ